MILLACSKRYSTNVIKIAGSDTMLPLTEQFAAQFMKDYPGISIYVEGGGTAKGVEKLTEGDVNICTASRKLQPEEVMQIADKFESVGMAHRIAKDALSIYMNHDNPVRTLTTEQLKQIFTCEVNNWKDLGGLDKNITTIIRNPNSGTYLYFQKHILKNDEYCSNAKIANTTESVIEQVAKDTGAVGYGGVGYNGKVMHAKVDGIQPNETNIIDDKYPISRYLYFYTKNKPEGMVKEFIDWALSPAGQKIVRKAGYIPLWEQR